MNDQAANVAAAELLAWVKGPATDAQGFIIEQAPLYAQEVVAYERVSSTTWAAVSLLVFIISAVTILVAARRFKEDVFDVWAAAAVVSLFAGGISLGVFFGSSSRAIKAWTAPRMVVVEHMRGMVR